MNMPLRFRYPKLHNLLMEKLMNAGLQPYDVMATLEEREGTGTTSLYIRFGAGFGEAIKIEVEPSELLHPSQSIEQCLDSAVNTCRQAVIGEYRVAMKSRP